jgi:hypothetical protein
MSARTLPPPPSPIVLERSYKSRKIKGGTVNAAWTEVVGEFERPPTQVRHAAARFGDEETARGVVPNVLDRICVPRNSEVCFHAATCTQGVLHLAVKP